MIFPSVATFLAGVPLTYSRAIGISRIEQRNRELGWYLQDDWRLTQTDNADRNNFAPRAGFAWGLQGKSTTILRAGTVRTSRCCTRTRTGGWRTSASLIRGHYKDACGVTVDDIAKRLIDYGFHAPTMSFPVAGQDEYWSAVGRIDNVSRRGS